MSKPTKVFLIIIIIFAALLLLAAIIAVTSGRNLAPKLVQEMRFEEKEMGYGESAVPPMPTAYESDYAAIEPIYDEISAIPGGTDIPNIDQRVIKDAYLELEVESAEDSANRITNIAVTKQGFVQRVDIYESPTGAKSGTVTIRVPVGEFETTVQEIKNLANLVISETVSGQDVTEEYIDLEAQLKNKYAEEEQYLEILDRALTIEDILKVTERLSWVRAEIERLEGRMKYLENLTDMSTITSYLEEEKRVEIPVEKWRPLETIRNAFRAGIAGFQVIADALIWIGMIILFFALPILIIIGIIVWIVRAVKRHKKKR